MNTLFIDTSSNAEVSVGITINGEKKLIVKKVGEKKAQVVLPMIKKLLGEHSLSVKDITHIEVNAGPGSYTGLRVGVAIANTLSYLLNIPVNNKKQGALVEPEYS